MCAAVFLFASTGYAQGNLHIGRLKVITELSYQGRWDDNIYFAPTHTVSDYVNILTPGIQGNWQGDTEGNYFDAGFNVDIARYVDQDINDYETYRLWGGAGYKSPAGFYIKARDFFVDTADPYGAENQFRLGVPQTQRWYNTFDIAAGYEYASRYGIEAEYRNHYLDYDNLYDEWQDRRDNRIGISLFYNYSSKTTLFVQYRRTDADYYEQNDGVIDVARSLISGRDMFWSSDTSQDYTLNDFFIGARFAPGGKLSGEIKIGYGDKDFDNTVDINGNPYEDGDTWISETSVNYEVSSRTLITAELFRGLLGSPDLDSSSYDATQIGISLNQRFYNKFLFDIGLWYGNEDYNQRSGLPNKDLDIYTFRTGLGYEITDWLGAGIKYRYQEKDSDSSFYRGSEYDQNRFTFGIKATY